MPRGVLVCSVLTGLCCVFQGGVLRGLPGQGKEDRDASRSEVHKENAEHARRQPRKRDRCPQKVSARSPLSSPLSGPSSNSFASLLVKQFCNTVLKLV